MFEDVLEVCLIGTGAFGAILGIGCSCLVMRALDAPPSSALVFALIGGTIGALTSYTIVFGGMVFLLYKVMKS